MYSAVDADHLYTLGTVVVDYRGYRVTAQSIIPGILEREQEQSVVYGSIDFGSTVVSNSKYLELVSEVWLEHVLGERGIRKRIVRGADFIKYFVTMNIFVNAIKRQLRKLWISTTLR